MTKIPTLLGALGLVCLGFGLLSLILALFGAPTKDVWILGNFVVGGVLLVSSVATNIERIRERVSSSEGKRIGKYGTSAVAQTAILLLIVAMLAFLANRYNHRFDLSEGKVHSLTSQTLNVLETLDRDVVATGFYRSVEQVHKGDLLDRYSYQSERFKYQIVDPNARPDLIETLGVNQDQAAKGALHIKIGEESLVLDEVSETTLTNALVKLTRTGEKKIYVVTGHNERAIEGEGAEEPSGYARAAEALRNENYRIETLFLATVGNVPDDADVVLLIGPTRLLQATEQRALERYLAADGALYVSVDPRAKTNVGESLKTWGVDLGDDVIVDRQFSLNGQPTAPLATFSRSHEITQAMREAAVFPGARSVDARRDGGGKFTGIVETSETSWAETDLEEIRRSGKASRGDDDRGGPVSVAVAGSPGTSDAGDEGETKARLVVFGDSDYASNQGIDVFRNRDLFVNSVNWLLGDIEAISIRPGSARASRLLLSKAQFDVLRPLALFVVPELILVIGVFVWWRRRAAAA